MPSIRHTLPEMGFVSLLFRPYEILTDDFIQKMLYDLYSEFQIGPDCLVVSEKGRRDLRAALESSSFFLAWVGTGRCIEDIRSEYPNRVREGTLPIVTLSGLPDGFLCAGVLQLPRGMVKEEGSASVYK